MALTCAMTLPAPHAALAGESAAGPAGLPDAPFGEALGIAALASLRARGDADPAEAPATDAAPPAPGTASVTGNSVTGAETGTATVRDSINNNTGFTTVFQNTGNNVLFQSTTIVNITVR